MDCNLRCNYCFEENKVKDSKPSYEMKDLVEFVELQNPYYLMKDDDDASRNGVVFTGGEPLMNQAFIRDFMAATRDEVRLEYVLQTNGTLLDKIDPYVLENLNYVFVSVDGPRHVHDANRGAGTFDKIIANTKKIKPNYKGQMVARITATVDKDFSIYDSVMALAEHFNSFHWQIETPVPKSTTKKDRSAFVRNYKHDISRLFDYWIGTLQRGENKDIIPFQSIITPIVTPFRVRGLRCGAGHNLVAIDLDGQCYGCDTMVGDPRAKIGSIYEGVTPERLFMQLSANCSGNPLTCKEETYKEKPGCMKQCTGCSAEESADFYCSTVHALANEMFKRKDVLNGLLHEKEIGKKMIMQRSSLYTEQIP